MGLSAPGWEIVLRALGLEAFQPATWQPETSYRGKANGYRLSNHTTLFKATADIKVHVVVHF